MLQSFIKLAPIIPKLLGNEEVTIWATDEEKYILMEDHAGLGGFYVGMPLVENGTPKIAMKNNQIIDRIVPWEVYNKNIRSVCIPVEGGTIGLSVNIDRTRKVLESIESLYAMNKEVTISTIEIANKSNKIAEIVEEVFNEVQKGNEKRKALSQITNILYNITKQLKILSINAMIEASRAKESGKAFNVVANEVQKLSDNANKQLTEIQEIIEDVSRLLEFVIRKMEIIQLLTVHQSHNTHEISKAIQKVTEDMETLRALANKM